MPEDTKKDKKEKTLSLKTNTKSSKSTIGTRSRGSSRVSTVVVESKRGKISKTRKPNAPNIKTRTSSVTSPQPIYPGNIQQHQQLQGQDPAHIIIFQLKNTKYKKMKLYI